MKGSTAGAAVAVQYWLERHSGLGASWRRIFRQAVCTWLSRKNQRVVMNEAVLGLLFL